MLAHTALKLPKANMFTRLAAVFRKTDPAVDEGQAFDHATLSALRDLPPHILKDIGVYYR